MPMGAGEFMCLCTKYVSIKQYFLLGWAILDKSIINLVKKTLSDRTHIMQAITSEGVGENALKKQTASYDKLSVSIELRPVVRWPIEQLDKKHRPMYV